MQIEASRQARLSPLFFDLTISLSKSISIFHASLGEDARLARQASDNEGDRYWSALVGEADDMIWQAVWTGFEYFQLEAGYTRTGSHNTRVHGRETGQWREADLAVAHWLQHTSRDGDMQLHVHSQIAHVAKTATDGKWRAPDSLGYPKGCCCTCATPTRSKRPGRPSGLAMSSARSAPPPGTPGWPGSVSAEAVTAQQRGEYQGAASKQELAGSYQALHDAYRQRETVFADTMADRDDWEKAAVHQRHLAVAADAELRRRHPEEHYPPLRSPEPEPATSDQREELTMTAGEETRETWQWIKDLAAAHRTFADRLADRLSLRIPSQDPDYGDLGQAFPPWPGPGNDAILQPPKPEIRPYPQVLQRAADRDADYEAAD